MSTRASIYATKRLHIFRDVVARGIYLDIGPSAYNRAWRIWPPTLRRLY